MTWLLPARVLFACLTFMLQADPTTSLDCPQQCACSRTHVDCYGGQLTEIPDNIPDIVTFLTLKKNQITELDTDKISHLKDLQYLYAQMNYITEIPSQAFDNLSDLKNLDLSNNEVETVASDAFHGLAHLRVLNLASNKLSDVAGTFDNISSLERLDLSQNAIESIGDDFLVGLEGLRYLVLSGNKIKTISKSAFDGVPNLTYLMFRDNPLKSADNIFRNFPKLDYIDLSSCQLSTIPKGLPTALKHLRITDNELTKIGEDDLADTPNLLTMSCQNNLIQTIDNKALAKANRLYEFRISNNRLRQLPTGIPVTIERFICDHNQIQRIFQFNFQHNSAMQMLSLTNNSIGAMAAYTFSYLSELNSLMLGYNNIVDIGKMTFTGLGRLGSLNINANPVKIIDEGAFEGLYKLKRLSLANIDSSNININGPIFQDMTSLYSLDLSASPYLAKKVLSNSTIIKSLRSARSISVIEAGLTTMPGEVRTSLPLISSFKISKNPWRCDKNLLELRRWIISRKNVFRPSKKLTCASPMNLKGRSIEDIAVQEFTMPPPSTTTTTITPSTTMTTPKTKFNTDQTSLEPSATGSAQGRSTALYTVMTSTSSSPEFMSTASKGKPFNPKSDTSGPTKDTTEKAAVSKHDTLATDIWTSSAKPQHTFTKQFSTTTSYKTDGSSSSRDSSPTTSGMPDHVQPARAGSSKAGNPQPASSDTANTRTKLIIIGVPVGLLVVAGAIFMAVALVYYRRRNKRASISEGGDSSQPYTNFGGDTATSAIDTSDTVVIINNMAIDGNGQHWEDVNCSTENGGTATEDASKKTNKQAKSKGKRASASSSSSSSSSKKGSKCQRQWSTTSSASSKTSFDCVNGNTEDDSDLLMSSWK